MKQHESDKLSEAMNRAADTLKSAGMTTYVILATSSDITEMGAVVFGESDDVQLGLAYTLKEVANRVVQSKGARNE